MDIFSFRARAVKIRKLSSPFLAIDASAEGSPNDTYCTNSGPNAAVPVQEPKN